MPHYTLADPARVRALLANHVDDTLTPETLDYSGPDLGYLVETVWDAGLITGHDRKLTIVAEGEVELDWTISTMVGSEATPIWFTTAIDWTELPQNLAGPDFAVAVVRDVIQRINVELHALDIYVASLATTR